MIYSTRQIYLVSYFWADYWVLACLLSQNHFVNVWITRSSLVSNSESKGKWSFVEEDNEPVPSTTLEIAKCFFALPTACFIGGIVVRRVGKTSVILSQHGQLCYCCCPDHSIGDQVEFIVWPMVCSISTFNIAVNCLVFCEKWLKPGEVRDEFYIKKTIDEEQVSSKQCNYPGLGTIHDTHHLLHRDLVDVKGVDMVVGFERLISPDACSPSFQWVIKRLVNSSTSSLNNSVTSSTSHNQALLISVLITLLKTVLFLWLKNRHCNEDNIETFVVQKKGSRGSIGSVPITPPQFVDEREYDSIAQMSRETVLSSSAPLNNSSNDNLTHPHEELSVDYGVSADSQPDSTPACSQPTTNGTAIETKKTAIGVVLRVTSTLVCLYSPDFALPKFLMSLKSFKDHPQPGEWYNLCVPYPVIGHKSKCGNIVLKGVRAKRLQEEAPLKTCLMESVVVLRTEVCVGNPTSTGLRYCYSSLSRTVRFDWPAVRLQDGPVHWNIVLMDNNKSCTIDPFVVQQEENQRIDQNDPSPSSVEVEEKSEVTTDDQVGLVRETGRLDYFLSEIANREGHCHSFSTAAALRDHSPSDFKVSHPSGDKVLSDLIRPIYDSHKLIGPENVGTRMKVMVACDTISQSLNQFKWTIVHLRSGLIA
uniref:CST complex subunit CTC1 n=1 Tax=Ditylenchus dipsaci TaxID=166011 RepID=A0A915CQ24_9BILA